MRSMKMGAEKAEADFSILMTIAAQEPVVVVQCPALWNLYFSIHTNRSLDSSMKIDIAAALSFSNLQEKYPDNQRRDVQARFIRQWCANACSSAKDAREASTAIFGLCEGIISTDNITEYSRTVVSDAAVWAKITGSIVISLDAAALEAARAALGRVLSEWLCKDSMLAPLYEFPQIGKALIQQLSENVAKIEDYFTFRAKVTATNVYTACPLQSGADVNQWAQILDDAAQAANLFLSPQHQDHGSLFEKECPEAWQALLWNLAGAFTVAFGPYVTVAVKYASAQEEEDVNIKARMASNPLCVSTQLKSILDCVGKIDLAKSRLADGSHDHWRALHSWVEMRSAGSLEKTQLEDSAEHNNQVILSACGDLAWASCYESSPEVQKFVEWARTSVLPLVRQSMGAKVSEHVAVLSETLDKVACVIDKPSDVEMSGDDVARFNMAAEKLEQFSGSYDQTEAEQSMLKIRWVRAALACKAVLDQGMVPSEESVKRTLELQKHAAALLEYIASLQVTVPTVDQAGEQHATANLIERAASFKRVAQESVKAWDDQCMHLDGELRKQMGPPQMLSDPKALTDEDVYRSIAEAAKAIVSGSTFKQAGDLLTVVKSYEDQGGDTKDCRGMFSLRKSRPTARALVGYEWALTKVKTFEPTEDCDLQAHATSIEDKLKGKGFKVSMLPPHLL
jgi:hypothetical protein